MNPFRLACAVVVAISSAATAQDSLTARVDAVTHGPDYKSAHWGVLIVDAQTGKPIYEQNADRMFTPASTTKLYTCATALAAFGPGYRFETPVYRRGEVKDGRLDGDLILVASGDLTLGGRTGPDGKMLFTDTDHTYANPTSSTAAVTPTDPLAGLDALAKQVKDAGIRQVNDVLIDDRLFPAARGTGSGPDQLVPTIVNDNVIDVIVEPGSAAGEPARVSLRPQTAFVHADFKVTTAEKGASPMIEVTSGGKQRFTVRGRIAVGSKRMVRLWPVDEPAAFARALFIEALRRAGVEVAAKSLTAAPADLPPRDGYDKANRVAVFTSPPLSEAVKVTLKVSHNLYASTLPLLVSTKSGQPSIAAGLRAQRRFLLDLGVPVETISFAGGAGGAPADCVTPRATVKLLQAMRTRKEYAAWHAGFPVLGVDGTLADVVAADSPAKGKVQAKTGTLSWLDAMNGRTLLRSKALAGTLTTASGKELLLAMFVNDVPLPPGVTPTREGRTLGRLCEIIYEHGP
jgi:D-alanyl-D-alanine carboxypeptidase/D-alanyl-D-alanine-endopeptidase (penicillin-binding protein 4)